MKYWQDSWYVVSADYVIVVIIRIMFISLKTLILFKRCKMNQSIFTCGMILHKLLHLSEAPVSSP